jgi:hypothetical protein
VSDLSTDYSSFDALLQDPEMGDWARDILRRKFGDEIEAARAVYSARYGNAASHWDRAETPAMAAGATLIMIDTLLSDRP